VTMHCILKRGSSEVDSWLSLVESFNDTLEPINKEDRLPEKLRTVQLRDAV
jgi:hypothetical protein